MKLTTLTALVFVTTAMLAHTPATALERTNVYNGSYCNPRYGSESAYFTYGSGITNGPGQVRRIICPVLLTDGFINKGAYIWVYASAFGGSDKVDCTFYSLDNAGTVVDSKSGSRTGSGSGWLLPSSGGTPGVTPSFAITTDHASYVMHCYLPPFGAVLTIQVSEHL